MALSSQFSGSSPLTRGKRRDVAGRRRGARLIPAHAGKTRGIHEGRPHAWAHPRSRGENAEDELVAGLGDGSSPLTRGKREFVELHVEQGGLIPAHAGKTMLVSPSMPHTSAHPRSRGENGRLIFWCLSQVGSSPLTRGKLHRRGGLEGLAGLIPAHAGKTIGHADGRERSGAHPRSRGENRDIVRAVFRRLGSSPLTRGKRERSADGDLVARLIPAHAGKTQPEQEV